MIRSYLPKIAFAAVLVLGMMVTTQSAQAQSPQQHYGAFRGFNNSAAFRTYGYRTGTTAINARSYSGSRWFGYSGRRWRFRR